MLVSIVFSVPSLITYKFNHNEDDNNINMNSLQAIKDMDYIIKEKTLVEKFFNCEIENYLTESM